MRACKLAFGKSMSLSIWVEHIRHPDLRFLNLDIQDLATIKHEIGGLLGDADNAFGDEMEQTHVFNPTAPRCEAASRSNLGRAQYMIALALNGRAGNWQVVVHSSGSRDDGVLNVFSASNATCLFGCSWQAGRCLCRFVLCSFGESGPFNSSVMLSTRGTTRCLGHASLFSGTLPCSLSSFLQLQKRWQMVSQCTGSVVPVHHSLRPLRSAVPQSARPSQSY